MQGFLLVCGTECNSALSGYYFDVELGAVIREAILWEKKVHYNLDLTVHVSLTAREIEIIKMACVEMSSKEIGR